MSIDVADRINLERKDTHPLQDLITAPLQAMIKAQEFTTDSIMDYIFKFCDGDANTIKNRLANNEPLPLKNMEFLLNRAEQNEKGEIKTRDYLLQIPLITMFPVPHLGITNAELSLNFKVVDVIKKEEQDEDVKTGAKGIFKNNIIQTRYTSSKMDSKESTSDISIKITIGQPEPPLGLAKFLTNASNSIIEKNTE